MIDEEIKNFVIKAESRAEQLLSDNIDNVHVLAKALLEFETLDDVQLDQLLEGKTLEKPVEPEKQPEETEEDQEDQTSEERTSEQEKQPSDD